MCCRTYSACVAVLDEYRQNPQTSFFLWLRRITELKLLAVHRQHLGTEKRDAAREISLHRGGYPTASSASLAAQLMGRLTSPSLAAVKAEMRIQLQECSTRWTPSIARCSPCGTSSN